MDLQLAVKAMGDVFASLAVREPQPRASEAFRLFGEQHRNMEKVSSDIVKKVKPVSIKKSSCPSVICHHIGFIRYGNIPIQSDTRHQVNSEEVRRC